VTDGQRTDYTHGLAAAMPAGLFPPAGYQGPYSGLGPNLNPTPTAGQTTTSVGAVLASGSREVDADIFGFRFGPYLELPITRRFSVSASAGLALALVHDQVWWTEQLAVNTANVNHYWTGQSSVAGDSLGVTAGFYLGAGVNYYLSPKLRLFGGGRFQDAGTYRHEIGQGEMNLDLRQAFNLELGLGYSF